MYLGKVSKLKSVMLLYKKHAKVVPSQRPLTFPSIPQGSSESPNDRKQKSNELSKDIEE